MVSGLVTSPWLQLRIFSGEAREMRIESKSAIKFARSYGEDRIFILPKNQQTTTTAPLRSRLGKVLLIRRERCVFRRVAELLHQFDVEAERLQLPNHHVERFRHAGLE